MRGEDPTHRSFWEIARLEQNTLLIRRLEPSDLKEALEIDQDVFGGYDPTIFATFYESHSNTSLVALMNGKVVGFILGFKHTFLEGRIFWLAVKPAYQNRGIATRLLSYILNIFKHMGAVSATLEVRASNKIAQSLYSSMGFQMTGIFPNYYTNGEMAIIMKKRL
ncbi:MAG: ribosomal protein S18-alanine N-acetyltransferase [Methanotrichaceae archaeon]|nr:ribosomal protein S18-alanine N-acetyltransferase [Methanotrichaceae archaeon]